MHYTITRYGSGRVTRSVNGQQFGQAIPTPWDPFPGASEGGEPGGSSYEVPNEAALNEDYFRRKALIADARKLEIYEEGQAKDHVAAQRYKQAAEHYAIAASLAYMQAELGPWQGCGKGPGGKPSICKGGGFQVLGPKEVKAAEKRGDAHSKLVATYNKAAAKRGFGPGSFPGLATKGKASAAGRGAAAATPAGRAAIATAAGGRRGFVTTPQGGPGVQATSVVQADTGELSTGAKVAIGLGTAAVAIGAAWYFMG